MHMQRPALKIEVLQRLLRSSGLQDRSRIVPGVFEHLREGLLAAAQHQKRLLIPRSQSAISQSHGTGIRIWPARWLNREVWIVDVHHRNRTRCSSIRRALCAGGQPCPLCPKANDNLTGNALHSVLSAITAEYEIADYIDHRSVRNARRYIFEELEIHAAFVTRPHRDGRTYRVDIHLMHRHRLKVAAVLARGLQSRREKPSRHILRRALIR